MHLSRHFLLYYHLASSFPNKHGKLGCNDSFSLSLTIFLIFIPRLYFINVKKTTFYAKQYDLSGIFTQEFIFFSHLLLHWAECWCINLIIMAYLEICWHYCHRRWSTYLSLRFVCLSPLADFLISSWIKNGKNLSGPTVKPIQNKKKTEGSRKFLIIQYINIYSTKPQSLEQYW